MAKTGLKTWNLIDLVSLAIIGTVFAFLYLGWVQLWLLLQSLFGPLVMDVMMGFWYSGSIFAMYLIRKPLAALLTAMVAVTVQILAGNPSGAVLLLTGLVQGSGSEVPFALSRYTRFDLPWCLLSGGVTAVFSFVYTWFRFSYWTLDATLLVAMFFIRLASGVLLGGLWGWFLARMVLKTGVANGLAAARTA